MPRFFPEATKLFEAASRIESRVSSFRSRIGLTTNYVERQLLLQGKQAAWQVRKLKELEALSDAEFSVFSQWGEDGIIDWLAQYVPVDAKIFVEFGVANYLESNTRFLLQNRNWRGLVMDGSAANIARIRQEQLYWRHDLQAKQAFITHDNINQLIAEAGIKGDIGILSVDIDGNDYWVLEAIDVVHPRILICEYNPILGDTQQVVVPYKANFERFEAHHCGLYFGTSIAALRALAKSKGYQFVGTCSNGINAFFVRDDVYPAIAERIRDKRAYPSRHRDSRDAAGQLTFTGGTGRLSLIEHLPVVEISSGRESTLSSLKPLYSDAWLKEM